MFQAIETYASSDWLIQSLSMMHDISHLLNMLEMVRKITFVLLVFLSLQLRNAKIVKFSLVTTLCQKVSSFFDNKTCLGAEWYCDNASLIIRCTLERLCTISHGTD